MKNPVAEDLIGDVALDRLGQHVGRSPQEVNVLGAEAAGIAGVNVEHAEGVLLAVDHHRKAAGKSENTQHRGHRKALLDRPVCDDHMQA